MATTLVVPGVRVEARFDILPPQPAAAGIVGVVGIVDRPGVSGELTAVTKVSELREILGPGAAVTMPQAVHALGNGASEVVVSPVTGGGAAKVGLKNADGVDCVQLVCRSFGAWANDHLKVEVRDTRTSDGTKPVRVTVRLLRDGSVVEVHPDLRVAPGEPDDLFDTINSTSAYVVAIDPTTTGTPVNGDQTFQIGNDGVVAPIELSDGAGKKLFQLVPAAGADPHNLRAIWTVDGGRISIDVFQNGLQERHTGLTTNPDDDNSIAFVLASRSALIRVRAISGFTAVEKRLPAAGTSPFADGSSPTVDAYRTAIDLLGEDPRIDLVLAAVEPTMSNPDVRAVHQSLVAHAVAMADSGAPRIAFGSVTAAEQPTVSDVRDHASVARNRRFVLVSPAGAEGAVAGLVGQLAVQDAPTFKGVPLFGIAPARYRESQLNVLLGPTINACVVQDRRGRGVVCLKGIDTTGDQISVTRVADAAIRETKAISENFIGSLNTDAARIALRQQIVAAFTRMERAGALVPSTDGTDPAFIVDVYSTQQDFANGIVRVDIAVRPVRSIDYIYATIRVKN